MAVANFFQVLYISPMDFRGYLTEYKKYTVHVLVVVAIAAFGSAYYFYNEVSTLKKDSKNIAKEENLRLIASIGKLIILPEGETPTVVTVSNPEALKTQPFFAKTKKGDKLLLYATAKKAILYDPENNKIVEVAPINIGESSKPASTPKP